MGTKGDTCMTIKYRIEQLERNYDMLDIKIDKLLENHLPHLSEDIATLKSRFDTYTIINVGAIIMGIIVLKFFK